MWKYNIQIAIRWLSFIACVAVLSSLAYGVSNDNPELFTKAGFKTEVTKIAVTADLGPLWFLPATFAVTVILMLAGLPSIVSFGFLLLTKGFTIAFAMTFAGQLAATYISMYLANKTIRVEKFPSQLREKLGTAQENYQSFAFWSRLYYSFPLRTIDSLTPLVHPESRSLLSSMQTAAPAILFRLLLPSLWLDSLLIVLTNLTSDPAFDATRLLLWSSALVAYTMIPRVPELFICPEKIKRILLKIESPNLVKSAISGDTPEKSPLANAKKLPGIKSQVKKETTPNQPEFVK